MSFDLGGGAKLNTDFTLWAQKHSCEKIGDCPDGISYKQWLDEDQKDENICFADNSGDVKGKDAYKKVQGAEAFAVLALLVGIVFVVMHLLYLFGKIRNRLFVLVPAVVTIGCSLICFAMFIGFYTICEKTMCEMFKEKFSYTDSCGGSAGVVFVWIAMLTVVGALVLALIRTPDALEGEAAYVQAGTGTGGDVAWGQPVAGQNGEPETQYAAGSV